MKNDMKDDEECRGFFDHAFTLNHIVAVSGHLIRVNSAWLNILGYSREEVEGSVIFNFIHNDDRENYSNYRHRLLSSSPGNESVRIRFIRKNGNILSTEGTEWVTLKNGIVHSTAGIFHDITGPELKEDIRNANGEKGPDYDFHMLLEYAPDAVVVMNQWGKIKFWNRKAEDIFGWTSTEMKNSSLTETIIPPEYREAHNRGMERFLKTGKETVINRTIEVSGLKKNGQQFPIALTISNLTDEHSIDFIAFIRDITVQKDRELKIEAKSKQLDLVNQSLQQYAALASHDLKEPLRKISVFVDILQSRFHSQFSEDALVYLAKISDSANHMAEVIEAVLEYSIMENTNQDFQLVDLNEVIEEVKNILDIEIKEKHALINTGLLPVMKGSGIQMIQLFQNLIANSLKYSSSSAAPLIEIQSLISDQEFQVIVLDNGIGFDNSFSKKIFDPFRRLHAKEVTGKGIGLALVKKIVDNHGGSIFARGIPGEGASFTITFPGTLLVT